MSEAEYRHTLAPRRYSPAALIAFWVSVFFLPGALLLGIIQTVVRDHEQELRHVSRGRLLQELRLFARDLSPVSSLETHFSNTLAKLAHHPNQPPETDIQKRIDAFQAAWRAETGSLPFLFVTGGPDLASVALSVADSRIRPPPARIVSAWFRGLAGMEHRRTLRNDSAVIGGTVPHKILDNLMNGFLGFKNSVSCIPGKPVAIFSRRNNGETMYLLLHLDMISNAIDSPVSGGTLLIIRERDISKRRMVRNAEFAVREPGIIRKLVRRPRRVTTLTSTWKPAGKGLAIECAAPLSLYDPAFNPDPRFMIMLRAEIRPEALVSDLRAQERTVRALVILAWTIGALLLLRLAFTGTLGLMPLRSKLVVLLTIAVGLPLILFFLSAIAYGRFSEILGRQERMNKLRQKLEQIETSIQSFSIDSQHRIMKIRDRLSAALGADERAISEVLHEFGQLKLYDSAYFIDSRGHTMLVDLSDFERRSSEVQKRKKVRFVHPSLVAFLKARGNVTEAITEKLSASILPLSGGSALLYGFSALDMNKYIVEEGQGLDVEIPELGSRQIRLFFPFQASPDGGVREDAVLILMGRPELLTAAAYDSYFKKSSSFFREMDGEYETRMAVFQIDTSPTRRLLDSVAWPPTAFSDREITGLARRTFENGWQGVISRPDGRIEAARTFTKAPFFAVGIAEPRGIHGGGLQVTFWFLIAYTLALLSLAAHFLGRLFANPLDGLIAAVHRLHNGEFGLSVVIKTADEFEVIGNEISRMSRGVRDRNRLRRFVSELAADAAATGRDAGNRVELTILFSHIRDFAAVSDALGPSGSVTLLNAYFTAMEAAVNSHSGAIDKFIGDAVMAVFHPDRTGPGHSAAACRAASAMRSALHDFNRARVSAGEPSIEIGIGIATGTAIFGRVGSAIHRQDFTVIGDTVNLAARLGSLAGSGAFSPVLLSEMTVSLIDAAFDTRAAGKVQVKGKLDPVTVYELVETEKS